MRYLPAIVCVVALSIPSISRDQGLELGALAHAQGKRVERHLRDGEAEFADQEYEEAIRKLTRVVDDDNATTAQRSRALELIGLSRFILGEREEASQWFLQLVILDPNYELEDDFGSEEIRSFFLGVKNEFLEQNAPVKLAHEAPATARGGQKIKLEVRAELGAEEAKTAFLFWRQAGEDEFQEVEMTPVGDGTWRARVTLPSSRSAYTLEYFMESRDIGDRPNGRLGSPLGPRTLEIDAGRKDRWYSRWYVIAGGVAVVGLTTLMVVAATR